MTDLPNEAYWRDKASLLEGMSRGHGPTDPVQVMAGTLAELAQSIRTGLAGACAEISKASES